MNARTIAIVGPCASGKTTLADGLQALTTLVLIIILWNGTLNIWLVLGFNTLRAVFQSFHGPAASTVTPMMVPKSKLQKINSMGQLFATLIDMGAVVLGASLYKIVAIQNILWVDIITFGFAIILLFRTKIPILKQKESVQSHLESEIKPKKPSMWKQFAEGIKVIQDHKGINSIANNFPKETIIIGLEVKGEIVIIEGMHRCCAIAMMSKNQKEIESNIFIALAEYPKNNLHVIGRVVED